MSIPTVGNKGSDVYASTGDPRVDLSVKCVRNTPVAELSQGVTAVLEMGTLQSLEDAFVMAFHARNIRGGKGERDLFKAMLNALFTHEPGLTVSLLDLVPKYGCWKDLFEMTAAKTCAPSVREAVLGIVVKQLQADTATEVGKSISLVAKWAPRETKMKALAVDLANRLFPTSIQHSSKMRLYRKYVAALNKRLLTVEVNMCNNTWADILPVGVPGRAGKVYNRAFLNLPSTHGPTLNIVQRCAHNLDRIACRTHFLEHFAEAAMGKVKINGADTLFPHEVVMKAVRGSSSGLDESEKDYLRGVWRGMVEKAGASGGLGRSIFMSDFSGSMQCSSSGDTPYWVSMALGILGSQVCSDEFRGRLLTFDSTPAWHTFPADGDLFSCIESIRDVGQGTSTDFQKAMDLVLQTLKDARMKPGQEPDNLIVLTDMNFDQACSSSQPNPYTGNTYRNVVKTDTWQTHIEAIREAFKRAGEDMWGAGQGFTMPRIVIWNLAASTRTDYHAGESSPGVAMLSGWSPSLFEVLQLKGVQLITPYDVLRTELDHAQYDVIRERIRAFVGPVVGPVPAPTPTPTVTIVSTVAPVVTITPTATPVATPTTASVPAPSSAPVAPVAAAPVGWFAAARGWLSPA